MLEISMRFVTFNSNEANALSFYAFNCIKAFFEYDRVLLVQMTIGMNKI